MARHIKWSESENQYVGTVDELPDVAIYGKSRGKVMHELEGVIKDLRELAKESGHDFPDIRRITKEM